MINLKKPFPDGVNKLEKIKSIIVCPKCSSRLVDGDNNLKCYQCDFTAPVGAERIDLYQVGNYQSDRKDSLVFQVKSLFKKIPWFYQILLYVVGPPQVAKSARSFLKDYSASDVVLNIGSGPKSLRSDVIDVDIFPYLNVNLLADAGRLPLADHSVDAVICESLIEHLPEPAKLINEVYRILKPGGRIYFTVPFMIGFHSSPNDFYRWTDQGLMLLFKNFNDIKVDAFYGPTSAMTFLVGEWLAILLSFNIKSLHNFWILVSMVMQIILKPLQLLDYLLVRYHHAKNIAYGFCLIAIKK